MRILNTNCTLKKPLCEWGGRARHTWSQWDIGLPHVNWCKFKVPHAHVVKIITYRHLFRIREVRRFDLVQPPNVAFKSKIIINGCTCDVRKLDTIWLQQKFPISYISSIYDCQFWFFLGTTHSMGQYYFTDPIYHWPCEKSVKQAIWCDSAISLYGVKYFVSIISLLCGMEIKNSTCFYDNRTMRFHVIFIIDI